ncbi:MAG: CxxC-x17-CxxC domain-containing protein [Patescibacteria group bacterium]
MKNFNRDRGGNRFQGGNNRRPEITMHKATCSNCGRPTEVPFKPTNGKPVYCRDCFKTMGGGEGNDRNDRGGDRNERRDFAPRKDFKDFRDRSEAPRAPHVETRVERPAESTLELKRQLESVNAKLDKLVGFAEKFFKSQDVSKPSESVKEIQQAPSTLKMIVEKAIKPKKATKKKK